VCERSWIYNTGNTGFFISLRSCRCEWLGIRDASMTLESGDSVLNIKGRVVDELEGRDLTGWQVEMLVWRESDSGADVANTNRTPGISEQTFLPIPADFEFDLNIHLTPRTYICVIPFSVAGLDGVPLSVSVIYQVGRLLEMR
jgi:hypothetical protein